MNYFQKKLTKLRKISVEEAIARCDSFSVYGSPDFFPSFFRIINDEETVRMIEKYAIGKMKEGIDRVEALREQAELHAAKEMNMK